VEYKLEAVLRFFRLSVCLSVPLQTHSLGGITSAAVRIVSPHDTLVGSVSVWLAHFQVKRVHRNDSFLSVFLYAPIHLSQSDHPRLGQQ